MEGRTVGLICPRYAPDVVAPRPSPIEYAPRLLPRKCPTTLVVWHRSGTHRFGMVPPECRRQKMPCGTTRRPKRTPPKQHATPRLAPGTIERHRLGCTAQPILQTHSTR